MSHVPSGISGRIGDVEYLGDGVYGARDRFLAQVWIWTSDGIVCSSAIALDVSVVSAVTTLLGGRG